MVASCLPSRLLRVLAIPLFILPSHLVSLFFFLYSLSLPSVSFRVIAVLPLCHILLRWSHFFLLNSLMFWICTGRATYSSKLYVLAYQDRDYSVPEYGRLYVCVVGNRLFCRTVLEESVTPSNFPRTYYLPWILPQFSCDQSVLMGGNERQTAWRTGGSDYQNTITS